MIGVLEQGEKYPAYFWRPDDPNHEHPIAGMIWLDDSVQSDGKAERVGDRYIANAAGEGFFLPAVRLAGIDSLRPIVSAEDVSLANS